MKYTTIYGISSSTSNNHRIIFEEKIVNAVDSNFISPFHDLHFNDHERNHLSPPSAPRRHRYKMYFIDESDDHLCLPFLDFTSRNHPDRDMNATHSTSSSATYSTSKRTFPKPRSRLFENINHDRPIVLTTPTPLRRSNLTAFETTDVSSTKYSVSSGSPTHSNHKQITKEERSGWM